MNYAGCATHVARSRIQLDSLSASCGFVNRSNDLRVAHQFAIETRQIVCSCSDGTEWPD